MRVRVGSWWSGKQQNYTVKYGLVLELQLIEVVLGPFKRLGPV